MDTVRCTVTCGHHWAGRQSELCQDFTPTEPAWRRRTRRGRAEEGAAWVPSPALGGTGQRALAPGVTRQASLLPLGRGIRVPGRQGPGVHRFPATGCFPPGHGSGPQVSRSQAVGQKPWTSACWAPRGQSGRRPTPRAGSEFAAVPVWGARPTADIWAGRWGRQGRACTPGVGVGHGGALCACPGDMAVQGHPSKVKEQGATGHKVVKCLCPFTPWGPQWGTTSRERTEI